MPTAVGQLFGERLHGVAVAVQAGRATTARWDERRADGFLRFGRFTNGDQLAESMESGLDKENAPSQ